MTIRAILVDDEAPAREELAFQLKPFADIDVVGQADDGNEALQLIDRKNPDLVFLDIQMPGRNGFKVAEKILERTELPLIVFVTAYDQYAVRAFELHTLDYLLKPVETERLRLCVEKVRRAVTRDRAYRTQLEGLLGDVAKPSRVPQQYSHHMVTRRGARILPVPVEEILFVQSKGGLVHVRTPEGLRTTNLATLEEAEAVLDPATFFRTHRSYVVNLKKIREIVPLSNQTFFLRIHGAENEEIPMSRTQAKELRKILRF